MPTVTSVLAGSGGHELSLRHADPTLITLLCRYWHIRYSQGEQLVFVGP